MYFSDYEVNNQKDQVQMKIKPINYEQINKNLKINVYPVAINRLLIRIVNLSDKFDPDAKSEKLNLVKLVEQI